MRGNSFKAALLAAIASSCLPAQVGTATITGRVTDSTGAVVPNAQITIVQPETNFKFDSVTNSEGIYRVQSLQPGVYTVTIRAEGFKTFNRSGMQLRTGDVLPVDAALEVGATSESVNVTAQSPLLETETSSQGTVTEGETLYKLPMYQRYITATMTIVPGLTVSTQGGTSGLGAYTVGGQRNTGTAMYQDGTFGVDPLASSLTVIKPIQNSTEEVKVLTGTLPAEYGHSTGGMIDVVMKSGTNDYHGSLSAYGRTRIMTHRQFFNKFTTTQAQPGNPNGVPGIFLQPDANFSGPVRIPKVYDGRNKTFFFFGWQRLIEKKTQSYTSQTPTPDELNGDFTFGGLGQALYDPYSTVQNADGTWSRTPFPSRIIPKSLFDPVAAKVLSYNIWRPPNTPGSFISTGPVSNYTYNPPSRTYFTDWSLRIDHQFNEKFKIYGSYTYNYQNGLQRPTSIQVPVFDGTTGYNTPFHERNGSFGATWLFGPTAVNDARVGYYRVRNDTFVPSYGGNWPQQLGIPNDDNSLMPSFTALSNALGSGTYTVAPDYAQMYGLTVNGPSRNVRQTYSFRDDFSKIVGTHAFKMGYEVLHFTANYFQLGQPSGQFQFDNMTAGLQPNGQPVPATGNNFAAFELGAVAKATFNTYTTTWLPQDSINSIYVQDDWKFSPRLTLNLGLRWSTESPYHTAHGLASNFSPTTVDPITGNMGAIIHPTGNLSARDWKNFQPRVGLAWHPLDKWVFRGGFAVNTVDIRWPNSLEQFDEYQALVVQQRANNDPRPLFRLSQGPTAPAYNVLQNGSAPYVGTNYSSRNVTWMDGQLHPGYVMNWNATIEYQMSANNLLKLFYAGSAGVHLVESWNRNILTPDYGAGNPALQNAVFSNTQIYLPYPQFGSINYMSNTGHSTYHAATVQFDKRYSHGLVLDAFYTFSKAIDDCDTDYGTCTGVEPLTNRNLNKGRAGYDMNHRFVGSFTYELPFGKGRRFMDRGGILNAIFGGYELAWIQTAETGNPISFKYTNNPNNQFPTAWGNWVPNVVSKPTMPQVGIGPLIGGDRFNQKNEGQLISPDYFAAPPAFTPGNAGRNIVTGPAAYYSQFSAKKNWPIKERLNFQLRFDFQNPFHNFAFAAPNTTLDFKNPRIFGTITGETATANIQGEPLMNLMLRLSF